MPPDSAMTKRRRVRSFPLEFHDNAVPQHRKVRFCLLLMTFATLLCVSLILTPPQKFSLSVSRSFSSLRRQQEAEVPAPGQIRTVRVRMRESEGASNFTSNENKTILLWTTYFSEEYSDDFYFFQEGASTFEKYRCEVRSCYVTSDKALLSNADAVLFHARDINFTFFPEIHDTKQIWILYGLEPPRYTRLKWKRISSLFNWTMTYRSDSDVQVKYGELVSILDEQVVSPSQRDFLSEKSKDALWIASNCRTESRREAYIKELKKYYAVDIYGKCGRKHCDPPQSSNCYNQLLAKYKFYLSFENSLCKDYVTEKFFNILRYDIVPIVFGGADYARIAPPNSYIDATQFPDPRSLASYLLKVGSDERLYSRFFLWKGSYDVHLHPWMCDLCRLLHNPIKAHGVPKNMWAWWMVGGSCRRWSKKYGFRDLVNVSSLYRGTFRNPFRYS